MFVLYNPSWDNFSWVYKLLNHKKKKKKERKEKFANNESEIEKNLEEIWNKLKPETVNFEALIDHIDHIIKLVGPNHVGIGSDYGGTNNPKGLESAAQYQNITAELLKRGYNEEDIIKILGGNLIKIMEKIQSVVR
ncbi:MAG: hypothetical protein FK730_03275 [Asgard group archaeon]|nr:hypothetical protein [Asgard group archaeon]